MENKTLIAKVGRHILLPATEDPQVVTISDKDKLSNQAFFQNAKNGDKALFNNAAKKAILYDPVSDKIVEVAPVNGSSAGPTPTIPSTSAVLATTATPPSPAATKSTPFNRYLQRYQHSRTNLNCRKNFSRTKESYLKQPTKDNTKKKEYDTTYVVDVNGNNKDVVSSIASALGGSAASLPTGEESLTSVDGKPVDIVVIIGTNFVKSAPAAAITATATPTPEALLVP